MSDETHHRQQLASARRVVVKVGTRLLVDDAGRLQPAFVERLVADLATLHAEGREVVLVSSGAVGAGLEALGQQERPAHLAGLQMAAAIGQSRLMARYDALFHQFDIHVGQVLLTHADLHHRTRHLNARNTMRELLAHRIVPVVNENDVVSVDELRVGDNDQLAALVTALVDADALILLTTTAGFLAEGPGSDLPPVPFLDRIGDAEHAAAGGAGGALSTGGMRGKLEAARTVNRVGALAVIADGRQADTLPALFRGESRGTLIQTQPGDDTATPLAHRKRWLAFFHKPEGKVFVDEGAVQALVHDGRSLLPIGITRVEGTFEPGSLLQIIGPDGSVAAHGLSEFGHSDLEQIRGLRTDRVREVLGPSNRDVVIHRDNLVLLEKRGSP